MNFSSDYIEILNNLHVWLYNGNGSFIFEKYLPGQNFAPAGDLFSVKIYPRVNDKELRAIIRKSRVKTNFFCELVLQFLAKEALICSKYLKSRNIINVTTQSNNDEDQLTFLKVVDITDKPSQPRLSAEEKRAILQSESYARGEATYASVRDPNLSIRPLINTIIMLFHESNPAKTVIQLTCQDRRYDVRCSRALYRYCHRFKDHPDESIRNFVDVILKKVTEMKEGKVRVEMQKTLTSLNKTLMRLDKTAGYEDYRDNVINILKQCCPALFRYCAAASLKIGYDKGQQTGVSNLNEPIAKFVSYSNENYNSDIINERLKGIWDKFETNNYWKRQAALFESISSIFQNLDEKRDIPLIADAKPCLEQLVNAFPSSAPGHPHQSVSTSTKKSTKPPLLVQTCDPLPEEPKVIVQQQEASSLSPIKKYHGRVTRWLKVSEPEHVRMFYDGQESPYAYCSSNELEKQVVDHGFSLAVDDLLKDSDYSIETDGGQCLVAQMIYPNGSVSMGLIHYGIKDGCCFHRHFSEKPFHQLIQKTHSVKKENMSIPIEMNSDEDSSNESISDDRIKIDQDTGIANIVDGRTGCIINVFKKTSVASL